MHQLLLIAFLLFSMAGIAQEAPIPRPDDQLTPEFIKAEGITTFKEYWNWAPDQNRKRNEILTETRQYNEEGMPVYLWKIGMDLVKTVDSTVYQYNGYGQLRSETIYTNYPIDVENVEESKFTRPPDTVSIEYIYSRAHQIDKKVRHDNNALARHDTTVYHTDAKGNVVYMDNSKKKVVNIYRPDGQLKKKTECPKRFISSPDGIQFKIMDTLEIRYIYNKEGLLSKIDSKLGSVTYVHDDQGRVVKAFEVGRRHGKAYDYRFEFTYDDQGNLTEMKKFNSGQLWDWERYEYNKANLCVKQYHLNIETKEVEIEVRREYIK